MLRNDMLALTFWDFGMLLDFRESATSNEDKPSDTNMDVFSTQKGYLSFTLWPGTSSGVVARMNALLLANSSTATYESTISVRLRLVSFLPWEWQGALNDACSRSRPRQRLPECTRLGAVVPRLTHHVRSLRMLVATCLLFFV